MKQLSLLIIISALSLTISAQDSIKVLSDKKERREAKRERVNQLIRQAEEGILVYEKQSIFGIQLRTSGYGAFYEHGRMKSNTKTNLYRIDITEIKSHKEEKLLGGDWLFGNPFIYGKVNYFYPVTIGIGQQFMLGQKGNKNGVAVSALYYGGLSLGLLRPYYVTILDDANQEQDIKYTNEDSTSFVDGPFLGSAGLSKGWGEIKVKPGAFIKGGMRFDYGRFNESVSALEIGISLDIYSGKVPVMLYQKDRQLFVQGYIALLFGRRK